MTIRIEVTDPATCKPAELRILASMLLMFAGDKPDTDVSTVNIRFDADKMKQAVREAAQELIDRTDNPAAGEEIDSAAQVFAGGAMPSEVFAGNAHGANTAPFTAVAGQPLIAPEATPGISTSPSASLPSAPASASAGLTVAPPAPPAPRAPGVELDSAGMPWDGRIHSSSREKVKKDDTWKKRRGIDDATVATVEAELRAVMSAPGNVPPPPPAAIATGAVGSIPIPNLAPAYAVPPPPPMPTPIAHVAAVPDGVANLGVSPPPAAVSSSPIVPPTVPAVANVPNVPPPPAPTSLHVSQDVPGGANGTTAQPVTFPTLLPKVTLALAQKTLSEERLKQVLAHYGLPSLPAIALRQDLAQPVHDALFGVA